MAPEQILGRAPSAASDIYSVGVIFYELLTGRHPHEARTLDEFFSKTCDEAPAPISMYHAEIAPDISDTIDRMLERRPRLRLTAQEALDRLLACRGVKE
jgi:serine/threonine-protein kinase